MNLLEGKHAVELGAVKNTNKGLNDQILALKKLEGEYDRAVSSI